MPRDGSGVYSLPAGTTASPNTTIESSKYNAFGSDLVVDANSARPITAGGTGQTSAQLPDGTWRFKNTADQTKLFALDLSGITTATTRTVKAPNYNGTFSLQSKGADIATAATIDLGAASGQFIDLTGTVTVTAVTLAEGLQRLARSAADFQITVGASLIGNGGANLAVKAGDLLIFEGYASGVVRFWCLPAQGGISAGDKTKLDGIEPGAEVNPTAAEIKTSYESNANTNAFTDALLAKLNGIAAGATVGAAIPTSTTYPVGFVGLMMTKATVGVGGTTSGANVEIPFMAGGGTWSSATPQAGTWANRYSTNLVNGTIGQMVRTA